MAIVKISLINSLTKRIISPSDIKKHSRLSKFLPIQGGRISIERLTKSLDTSNKVAFKQKSLGRFVNKDCAVLTKLLGEKVLSFDEISKLTKQYPMAKGRVGCLPEAWTNRIPPFNIQEKIKSMHKGLGEIVSDLRNDSEPKDVEKASDKLNVLFHSTGILADAEKVSIKKLDHGFFGTGYLIDTDVKSIGDKVAIKIFHIPQEMDECYGNFAEANKGQYWLKNAGEDTQFSRFYYADLNNGFLIDKYISDDIIPPKNIVDPKRIGLQYCDIDNGHNQKRGYIYDFGCLAVCLNEIVRNPDARKIFSKIYDTPLNERKKLIKSIYNDKNQKDYKNVIAGLSKALDFFPENGGWFMQLKIEVKMLFDNCRMHLNGIHD